MRRCKGRSRQNATNGLGPQWNEPTLGSQSVHHQGQWTLSRLCSCVAFRSSTSQCTLRCGSGASSGARSLALALPFGFDSASSSSLYRTGLGCSLIALLVLLWISLSVALSSFILFFFAVLALGLVSLPLSPRCDARYAYNNLSKAALVA